jgi:hypothetical protein
MSRRVKVRATVSLPKMPVGREALVDPDVPYVAAALEKGYLVRVNPPRARKR